MDVAGAAGAVAKMKGDIKALSDADKEVCALVAFVCDALCEITPALREPLLARVQERLREEFDHRDRHVNLARTLRHGLELIERRLETSD